MKRTIVAAFLLMGVNVITAQTPATQTQTEPAKKKLAPPAAVQKAFEQKFPKATNVSWGKEDNSYVWNGVTHIAPGGTEWEAAFTFNGDKLSANFSADGNWIETEKKITVSEFPKAVTDAILKTYPGWKITEADKTETAGNGAIYEADIKSGTQKKEVAFKEDGTPLKK